jgi:hypothetical protein
MEYAIAGQAGKLGLMHAALTGATRLAGLAGLEAFRLADGRVALVHDQLEILAPADRLRVAYGGISAAVGVVPIAAMIERAGAERCIFYDSIDEHMTGDSSAALRDEVEAVLIAAAEASGAHYVTFAEQLAKRLAAERAEREKSVATVRALAAAPAGFVALDWDLGNACLLKDQSGLRVIVASTVRSPPQLDETLALIDAAAAPRIAPEPMFRVRSLVVRFAIDTPPEAAPCDVLYVRYSVDRPPPVLVRPFLLVPDAYDAGFGWTKEHLQAHFTGAAEHVCAATVGVIEGPRLC